MRSVIFPVLLADPVAHFGGTVTPSWPAPRATGRLVQHTAGRGWDIHIAAMTAYLDTAG
ncbi:hypothetical protein [Dactylosporangium sp. NPDC000521]|uniref:hypothetical protein n=1 Tax=Dactylosporangium sp. NPDC000521 TaxID=3363975 RepID=UPI0036B4D76B